MLYKEYVLTDLGFVTADGFVLKELWGLDNVGDHKFYHAGYSGYPDVVDTATIHMAPETEDKSKVLYVFTGKLDGGAYISEEFIVNHLIQYYNWPIETTLDSEGLPTRPPSIGEPDYIVPIVEEPSKVDLLDLIAGNGSS